jgi:general stress protein YciG
MAPERRREIAALGGKAAHAKGVAHQYTPAEAKVAGRKGGLNKPTARANEAVEQSELAGNDPRTGSIDCPYCTPDCRMQKRHDPKYACAGCACPNQNCPRCGNSLHEGPVCVLCGFKLVHAR